MVRRPTLLVLAMTTVVAMVPAAWVHGHYTGYTEAVDEQMAWDRGRAVDQGTLILLDLCRMWNERVEKALKTRFNGGR